MKCRAQTKIRGLMMTSPKHPKKQKLQKKSRNKDNLKIKHQLAINKKNR